MSQHTPGPWRILEAMPSNESGAMWVRMPEGHDGIKGDGIHERSIGIRSTTAHMEDVFGSGEGGHIAEVSMTFDGRQQALANARVLVAAPDLYDALAAYVAWIDFKGDAITEHEMFERADALARAALAKARGEGN